MDDDDDTELGRGAGEGHELDVGDDTPDGGDDEPTIASSVPDTTITTTAYSGGRFLDDFEDDDGGSGPADSSVEPSKGWWIAPVAILAIIAVIGIIGAALDNNDNKVATTAAVATSTSTSTSTSTTATTGLADTSTTLETTTSAVTATNAASAVNQGMVIKTFYSNKTPAIGEEVTFDVTVSDPDAGPIGECGGSPPGGFGDGPYAPGCTPDCSVASTHSATETTFHYAHTYTEAGTYTVRFSYQSAGGCTTSNPYASTRTQNLPPITVS